MRDIKICDYTLRNLESDGDSQLLFREKLKIVQCIDGCGVDVIELPPIKKNKGDRIIYKTISHAVRNSVLSVPVSSIEDLEDSYNSISETAHPRIIVSLPVSTVQMEYAYRLKEPQMLQKVSELVQKACELCNDVEFEVQDASRSDMGFLIDICKEACRQGAFTITLCDEAGVLTVQEVGELVKTIKSETGRSVQVKLSDRLNLAVADALEAVRCGADGIKTVISGHDCLFVTKLSPVLSEKNIQLDIKTKLDFTKLYSDINLMLKQVKERNFSEAVSVADKYRIFLDKSSTRTQVAEAVENLGYNLNDEDFSLVYNALMQLCEKKTSIERKELEAIIASTAMQVPASYVLVSFVSTISNRIDSVSNVVLERDGEKLSGVATGGGPIDSLFKAIEVCIGHHYELDDFQIQAVTEGKEALGSALVKLRNNGKLYSGNGLSSDICGASVQAYVNALNKIVYEEIKG